MKQLEQYMEAFGQIMVTLQHPNKEPNVIIGGKWALWLHGLNMSQPPADLDIIIYNANPRQRAIFEKLRENDIVSDRPRRAVQEVGYEGDTTVKVIKLESNNGLLADIIKEEDTHPDGVESLLTYRIGNTSWPVQSIRRVIEAKASYSFSHSGTELPKEEGEPIKLQKYMRSKDLIDFIDLKNLNFNTKNVK
jgi:hypothetical protein